MPDPLRQKCEFIPDLLRSRMSVPLARSFGVSEEVVERRLEREGLWPPALED